jgi:flagellum-specific ATP synthase
VDALESVSRVMPAVATPAHRAAVHRFLDMMATYRESEDLINIGAYVKGSNPRIDRALKHWDAIREFLRQDSTEKADFNGSVGRLLDLIARAGIV